MIDIDWESMTQPQITAALEAGRAEGQRRINELLRAMGGAAESPKRGRPPANPLARFGGAAQEQEEEESANGAAP